MPAGQRQRIQMVLLRESGMTQPLIAAAMGVSLSTVNRAHMAYDTVELEALKPKPIGGRKRENELNRSRGRFPGESSHEAHWRPAKLTGRLVLSQDHGVRNLM